MDIIDALIAVQAAVSLITLSPLATICCDVNDNGPVTLRDALILAQFVAGLPVMISCG